MASTDLATEFQNYWCTIAEFFGFRSFKPEMIISRGPSGYIYAFHLTRDIKEIDISSVMEGRGKQRELFDKIAKPIADEMKASPYVKEQLADLQTKLDASLEATKKLESQVSFLTPFKHHFDLQYALENGKTTEGMKLVVKP